MMNEKKKKTSGEVVHLLPLVTLFFLNFTLQIFSDLRHFS